MPARGRRRSPHPAATRVGAPDVAVLRERRTASCPGAATAVMGGNARRPDVQPGPGGDADGVRTRRAAIAIRAWRKAYTGKVTLWDTRQRRGRSPARPRRRLRRPGSRCRVRTASARTTCAGSVSRARPGRTRIRPLRARGGLQQRQRLVGRPACDGQHVVERERLRVPAPPADRVVDVDDDAVRRARVHARHDQAGQRGPVVREREHDPLVRARRRRAGPGYSSCE